jgi:hypothetical protein
MDIHDAGLTVRQLIIERNEARAEVVAARRRVMGFEMAISGYMQLFPELRRLLSQDEGDSDTTVSISDHPRGQAAITEILESLEYRGKYWTVKQMTEELQKRGWEPDSERPANSVRVALSRLVDSNPRITRGPGEHGNVVFYYQAEGSAPPRFHRGEVAAKSSRN